VGGIRCGTPGRRGQSPAGGSPPARDGAAPAGHRRSRRLRPDGFGGRGHPDRRRQYRRLHADDDDGDRARDQQGQSDAGTRPRPPPDRDQHRVSATIFAYGARGGRWW
jgi:hypothetical protein